MHLHFGIRIVEGCGDPALSVCGSCCLQEQWFRRECLHFFEISLGAHRN
jgi:hypothetical protein